MMDRQNNLRAVLTGDIVNSSLLNARERQKLYEAFPALSARLRERYPDEVSHDLSNFRGDGWQVLVNHPRAALEVALFIRSYLRFPVTDKDIDSRVAIGIGEVDFVPEDNVSAGYGSAYTLSGHLLETLPVEQHMAVGFDLDKQPINHSTIAILVELMDAIISAWGANHCQAVFWALQGYNQKEIAERWQPAPITQPSVSYNLKRAAWTTIKKGLTAFAELAGDAVK